MRRTFGFTLIELLVVIAIIAVLAAILFPIFASAKKRGVQQRCLANLKQLGICVRMYADDWQGFAPNPNSGSCPDPPRQSWDCTYNNPDKKTYLKLGQLWPYVKNEALYGCPSDKGRLALDVYRRTGDTVYSQNYPLSYSMNCMLNWGILQSARGRQAWGGPKTISLDTVPRLKEVFLLMHESRATINDGYCYWLDGSLDMPSNVHYNGTTVSYLDGHAAWQSYDQLMEARKNGKWYPDK